MATKTLTKSGKWSLGSKSGTYTEKITLTYSTASTGSTYTFTLTKIEGVTRGFPSGYGDIIMGIAPSIQVGSGTNKIYVDAYKWITDTQQNKTITLWSGSKAVTITKSKSATQDIYIENNTEQSYANRKFVTVPIRTSYTVTYNANSGSGAPESQTKWADETLKLSTTKPTKTGYTFAGWATSSEGEIIYTAGANYTANASASLYAKYIPNTYKIHYELAPSTTIITSQTKTYDIDLAVEDGSNVAYNNGPDQYIAVRWQIKGTENTIEFGENAPNYIYDITLIPVFELRYKLPIVNNLEVVRTETSSGADKEEKVDGNYLYIHFNYVDLSEDGGETYTTPKCTIQIDTDEYDINLSNNSCEFKPVTIYTAEEGHEVTVTLYSENISLLTMSYSFYVTPAIFPLDIKSENDNVYVGIMTPCRNGQEVTIASSLIQDHLVVESNDLKADKPFEILGDLNVETGTRSNIFDIDLAGRLRCGDFSGMFKSIFDLLHPIGSYYWTSDGNFDPADVFGGSWEKIDAGVTLVSAGTGYTVSSGTAKDGGNATATLEIENMPAHNHGEKSLTGYVTLRKTGAGYHTAISRSGIVSSISDSGSGTSVNGSGSTGQTLDQVNINATHTHNTQGSGAAFNIMNPYKCAYCWHRIG